MKKLATLIFMCFSLCYMSLTFAANQASPLGFWKTIDDVSGQPKSILHVYEISGRLFGRVVKIFPSPGKTENEVCDACEGARHNQRIVGMVIMENLKQSSDNQNQWTGGEILDPKNGKTYHCNLTLIDNGQKLEVRGYIGISLFGRSQTWLRVSGQHG